jgi:hypothetical protein
MKEFKSNVQQKLEKKNAKPVNFDFLVPVKDYVTKIYGNIEEDLTRHDYTEIMQEIQEKNTLVVKNEDNVLYPIASNSPIQGYSKYSRWEDVSDEKRKEEPIKFLGKYIHVNKIINGSDGICYNSIKVELKDLYYISDYDKYANYLLDNISKETTKKVERIKKEEAKTTESLKNTFADLKTFDIKTLDLNQLTKERTVRELEDPKTTASRKLEILNNQHSGYDEVCAYDCDCY